MTKHCAGRRCTALPCADEPTSALTIAYAESLCAKGYSADSRDIHLRSVSHLIEWLAQRGIRLAELDEQVLARFLHHLPACRCRGRQHRGPRVRFRVRRFLQFLRDAGVATAPSSGSPPATLVTEYGAWMRYRRGLAESTIGQALPVVQALLDVAGANPADFEAVSIRTFVLYYVEQHAPASAGCITSIVRCFLRYLVMHGECSTDLIAAVPRVPTWRLARLPRYLADEDVERIIEACNRTSPMARRDRAMGLLLARLGLRAHEVIGLQLDDFDWAQGRLRVMGKGGRVARMPLPQDTGDASLSYLKTERPPAASNRVFLTARAPIGPLSISGLHDVVRRAMERAGVQTSVRGTHVLRHSLASRLLREGATLDTIGAVLRHRDVNTTALYAKVDVAVLRQVAQPWPGTEVSPC